MHNTSPAPEDTGGRTGLTPPVAGALPRRRLSAKKKLAFGLATMAAFFVLVIAAGEIGTRVYIHFRYGVPGKSYGLYMADDELGATHRSHAYNTNGVTNNWGFRNTEDVAEQKPAGSMRIYCSGGSTTYCYNLGMEEAWPSVLQRKLRQLPGHARDEVLNAGQICFAISQEFVLARRLLPRLKPDVVVLYTGINELLAADILTDGDGVDLDRLRAEQRWGVCPRHLDQARFLKRNSTLVRLWDYRVKKLLEDRATAAYRGPDAPQQGSSALTRGLHPWVVENFDHTFHDYLAFLRAQQCRVVVVRFGDNGVENWHLTGCMRRFRERAVELGREEGAVICDVAGVVEQRPDRKELFIPSGVHVTREGADVVADELVKVLAGKAVVSK